MDIKITNEQKSVPLGMPSLQLHIHAKQKCENQTPFDIITLLTSLESKGLNQIIEYILICEL